MKGSGTLAIFLCLAGSAPAWPSDARPVPLQKSSPCDLEPGLCIAMTINGQSVTCVEGRPCRYSNSELGTAIKVRAGEQVTITWSSRGAPGEKDELRAEGTTGIASTGAGETSSTSGNCSGPDVPGLLTVWPEGELSFVAPACREGLTYNWAVTTNQGSKAVGPATATMTILPPEEKKSSATVSSSLGIDNGSDSSQKLDNPRKASGGNVEPGPETERSPAAAEKPEAQAPPAAPEADSSAQGSEPPIMDPASIPSRIDFP
ncbi:MAG TPA: hypothetical protein VM598_12245 [Bdellovibrionota bacterium]|nr:hypothetical protein [Bdellovibrionota bacterium]